MSNFGGYIYFYYAEDFDEARDNEPGSPRSFCATFPTREQIDKFAEAQFLRWRELLGQAIGEMSKAGRSDAINVLRTFASVISNPAPFEGPTSSNSIFSQIPLLDVWETPPIKSESDAWQLIATMMIWFPDLAKQPNPNFGNTTQFSIALAQMANPSIYRVDTLIEEGRWAIRKTEEAENELARMTSLMSAALNKVREESIFKSASQLWLNKAVSHTIGYISAFLVILGTLGGIGRFVAEHAQAFIEAMPVNKTTGEFTYLAVLVVGLVFVALAWIYRMLGRFVLDNFTLASDARQRSMLLQTFLTLVGTPEAKMKESERVLILNAIFRPAPGQGADDPAPSSLVDLMKGALPTAGAVEKKS